MSEKVNIFTYLDEDVSEKQKHKQLKKQKNKALGCLSCCAFDKKKPRS